VHGFDHARRAAGAFFFQENAVLPAFERFTIGLAIEHDAVRLGMAIARVRQPLGQIAVVGQHHQAFAVCIEAADRKQMPLTGQIIEDRPAVVVLVRLGGRKHVAGLVQRHHDTRLVEAQPHIIDLDDIGFGVGFIAQFGDLAVDAHTALFDQRLGAAARSDTGLCEKFLQTLFHSHDFQDSYTGNEY
jgi:hypothetical protein